MRGKTEREGLKKVSWVQLLVLSHGLTAQALVLICEMEIVPPPHKVMKHRQ